MCVYNQQDTVERAVKSVLAQRTSFPFEIVLADDCSTDDTPRICARLAQSHPDTIRFIRRPHNFGIAPNYFDAIRQALGTYIADLAGDDLWIDSDKLQRQADLMDSDASIVLCHTAWRKTDAEGHTVSTADHFMPYRLQIADGPGLLPGLLAHQRRKWFVHLCSAMYRRDITMQLMDSYPQLFTGRDLPCEDFQLICALASRGKIAAMPEVTLSYTTGHASASSAEDHGKTSRFASRVALLTLSTCRALGYDDSVISAYLRSQMQYALINAIYSGDDATLTEARHAISVIAPICGIPPKTRLTLLLAPLLYKGKRRRK